MNRNERILLSDWLLAAAVGPAEKSEETRHELTALAVAVLKKLGKDIEQKYKEMLDGPLDRA